MAALASLFVFLPAIHAQEASPKTQQDAPQVAVFKAVEADLLKRKENFSTESNDMESIAKPLMSSTDGTAALMIDNYALLGVTYMDASYWYLGIYDRMQCDADKSIAKTALQNRLAFYAHVLDLLVGDTNRQLGVVKSPAMAQEGAQIRDEFRGAKGKLDEISASLQ